MKIFKKKINLIFFLTLFCSLIGCKKPKKNNDIITFATSAEYPPFESMSNGELVGFDIELGNLIALELSKKAVFNDMQFASILQSLENGLVDAAISTIAITDERKLKYDFVEYCKESISIVFKKEKPIKTTTQMKSKKIACQLGSTMHIWFKKNVTDAESILIDNNNQAIESLKASQVDGVLMDTVQAIEFCKRNSGLSNAFIAEGTGYGIAVLKNSPLYEMIQSALDKIKTRGDLEKLEKKWFS